MKKLIYVIALFTISTVLLSCKEEIVNPNNATEEVKAIPTEQSTEGGNEPDSDGPVKGED